MCWWTSEEARGRKSRTVIVSGLQPSPVAVACRASRRVSQSRVASRVAVARRTRDRPTPASAARTRERTALVAHTNHLQLSYSKSLRLNTVMRNALGGDQNLKKIHRSTTET